MEGLQPPQVTSADICGCKVCDDIIARVSLIVQHRDTQNQIAAAQIYRKEGNELQLLGLTNNFGRFIHLETVASLQISLHVISPNFIPYTLQPITLSPSRTQISITVDLIPLMNLRVGLGGSPITIRLSTMAAVSAPPAAFTMMETNETYNDVITFRGTVMTSSDDNEFTGVPGNSFMGMNEDTNEMQQYAVLLVTYLQFQSVEGETLTSDKLRLGVSVENSNGNLPPLSLIYYDESKGYWVNLGPFHPIETSRKKRQSDPPASPVFLESDGVPVDVFVALAANENANCWLQARTFDEDGNPFPTQTEGEGNGPLVSLRQRSDISGNRFLFLFGTDTGNIFNSDLSPNSICLPLRCSDFTIATLEAREEQQTGSASLLPNSFPDGMFSMAPSAPLEIGTIFTWDELFFPTDTNIPNPFYPNFASCQENARESNTIADRDDYFSFQIQEMIDVPDDTNTCFIKVQIRDCFEDNEITVTSINPDTGSIDNRTVLLVGRQPDITTTEITTEVTTEMGSGTTTFGTDDIIMTTTPGMFTCDETTASLRAACLPFVCSDIIQIFVRPNLQSDQTSFCQVTERSIIANTEIVSEISNNNEQIIIRSNNLKTDDYNDPNLGLYFDESSGPNAVMAAQARCNAGTGEEMSEFLNVETGSAITFSCF